MEENKPAAKLVNATIREPFYFSTYEYECIKCGKHFTRATYNSRISPYCADCCREFDRIKNRARARKKQYETTIKYLEDIEIQLYERITYLDTKAFNTPEHIQTPGLRYAADIIRANIRDIEEVINDEI